jgi:drug/metabolite transporter (DMT)-like permease
LTNKLKAHIAVLSANILFGVNFSAVQFITHNGVGSFGLNVLRVVVSTILFWILILPSNTSPTIEKKHIPRFFLCALTGIAINQMFFIKGLSMTLSIHASLLILVTPIFITIFAAVTGQEKTTALKLIGLALGIGGAAMLILQREQQGNAENIFWGDVLIVVNAISYAIYFLIVKKLMSAYNPIHVIRWVFTIGLLLVVPIGWNEVNAIEWSRFEWLHWLALSFIVIGGTFLPYLFTVYGIRHLGAGTTGAYIYTQPVFAGVIAVILLGEDLTMNKVLAAILIFAGVFLVNREK